MNSIFNLELNSIWSFEERGSWDNHKGDYPGNFSPKVARNLILRYSKEKDVILDQFIGSGTTAIEALLLKRKIIAIDINEKAINITENRARHLEGEFKVIKNDATKLTVKDNVIDFICTHPPYMDIIKYSNNINGDISLTNGKEFYNKINDVAKECYRVLKNNKYCAIVIGDIRKNGFIEPVGFNVMNIFLNNGFNLKEIIIKEQHNCRSTKKWIELAKYKNFLLINHEYIFVFKKYVF